MAEEDDPFSVFSDDESDCEDNNHDVTTDAVAKSKSLVDEANRKINASRTQQDKISSNTACDDIGSSLNVEIEEEADLSHLEILQLPWKPPLYQGPIALISNLPFGGGRGFVAKKRLAPGTLILVEEPIMKWPQEQLGNKLDLNSVRYLLECKDAGNIVEQMENFHPEKELVDDGIGSEEQISKMITLLRSQYTEDELEEVAKVGNIRSRDSKPLNTLDVLRLLLALRYNGLESGVYLYVAMLNHNCRPNCTKFLPNGTQKFSEVRTTRVVNAGECLTISYVPHVMSHASRRRHLWEQHRFDIGADLKGDERLMELIGKSLPPSSTQYSDSQSLTARIEKAIAELEGMYHELANEVNSNLATDQVWETIKAAELSALELYNESVQQLKNDKHLLLIPCLTVHLEFTHLVRNAPSLPGSVQIGIISRQVLSAMKLLLLQALHLGNDHFDLARTNLDLSNAISELLSRSPKRLTELNSPSLGSVGDWTSMEHKARREYNRIKALYPHDAEKLVEGRQGSNRD